jgi:TPR repeat protein
VLAEVRELAGRGDAEGQFRLGSLYYQGRGVPQDHKVALEWFRQAAGQGHLAAQVNLGHIYSSGIAGFLASDYSQSLFWYVMAASQGDREAVKLRDELALKMTPAQIAETQKLVREFRPAEVHQKQVAELQQQAAQGDAEAKLRLGVRHYLGYGMPVNYREALKWFREAARLGHVLAQANLGFMYEQGQGVPQDFVEAARWYHLAAQQGNPMALYSLGVFCERGQGVTQDEVQALKWYSIAAARGETRARTARDRISLGMSAEDIARAQLLAREFRIKTN